MNMIHTSPLIGKLSKAQFDFQRARDVLKQTGKKPVTREKLRLVEAIDALDGQDVAVLPQAKRRPNSALRKAAKLGDRVRDLEAAHTTNETNPAVIRISRRQRRRVNDYKKMIIAQGRTLRVTQREMLLNGQRDIMTGEAEIARRNELKKLLMRGFAMALVALKKAHDHNAALTARAKEWDDDFRNSPMAGMTVKERVVFDIDCKLNRESAYEAAAARLDQTYDRGRSRTRRIKGSKTSLTA